MSIEFYCYTRGEQPDYRDFCIPENVGPDIISVLRNMVRPILDKTLEVPRWILYRNKNIVVWGLCCKNELLSSLYNVDIKKRPVKGFFAFVCSDIDESNISIPSFDINFFKVLYEKEVSYYWNCSEGEFHSSNKVQSFDVADCQRIYAANNEYSSVLNTNAFRCRSLGHKNKQEVVAAALLFPEISLLIDNEDISEAIGEKESFMNCLSSSVAEKIVKVKRICPQCSKYVDEFTDKGICVECEKANSRIKENDVKCIELNNMECNELEQLRRDLKYCKLDKDQIENRLSKTARTNKILLIICGVFFLLITYLWHNTKGNISIFRGKEVFVHDTITIEKPYKFKVSNDILEIPAEGKDSAVITWKTDLPRMKTEVEDNWIEVLSENGSSIIIDIKKNETNDSREAKIELSIGEQKQTVCIKQASKNNEIF